MAYGSWLMVVVRVSMMLCVAYRRSEFRWGPTSTSSSTRSYYLYLRYIIVRYCTSCTDRLVGCGVVGMCRALRLAYRRATVRSPP